MIVKVKKINQEATLPTYGSVGAGCFDLYACEEVTLKSKESHKFDTGLAFEVPEGWVMLVYLRSSIGKKGLDLMGNVGVIDSDYRGSVFVPLINRGTKAIKISAGDRIAQAMVIPSERISFKEVDQLSTTKRGNGGFGSTGV